MNEISKRFEQFLIDENCFSQFCSNIVEYSHESFNELVNREKPENYIIHAFSWDLCKFAINWFDIHYKWVDLLEDDKGGS